MRNALALLLILLLRAAAGASVCETSYPKGPCLHWDGGTATLQSFFPPSGPLMNGTWGWTQNAVSAADEWNAAGAAFRFSVSAVSGISDPCGPAGPGHACTNTGPAGENPVFFADSACGKGFGDIVAQTFVCPIVETGAMVNAAVLVNSTVPWNAYDGPIQPPLNDIRRVLLHEFGHVLGLDHPDTSQSIMNPQESDIDHLQADDVDGLRSIYPSGSGTGPNGCRLLPGAPVHWDWTMWLAGAVLAALRRAMPGPKTRRPQLQRPK